MSTATTDLARIEDDAIGRDLLEHRTDFIRMLGGPDSAERFIQEAFAAVNANPFLRECTPQSLFGALFFAAQIDLPVGGPLQQFHLTPRNVWNAKLGEKERQVVPVVGYNGLITLAMNTGEYDAIEGKLVYANDDFEKPWDDESGTHFKLREADGDRGEILGVIGRALVKGADRALIEWLDIDTIRNRMRPSNWPKTPWKTDEAAMVKKTGIRRVSKYTAKSRKSHRFALAIEGDEALVTLADDGTLTIDHDKPASEDWATKARATIDKKDLEAVYRQAAVAGDLTDELTAIITAHGANLTVDTRTDRPSPAETAALEYGRDEDAVRDAARAAFESGEPQ